MTEIELAHGINLNAKVYWDDSHGTISSIGYTDGNEWKDSALFVGGVQVGPYSSQLIFVETQYGTGTSDEGGEAVMDFYYKSDPEGDLVMMVRDNSVTHYLR